MKNWFFFCSPELLTTECTMQKYTGSNYPKRSLNWHLFLSINIDSAPSWKIFMADFVCNVLFEDYIWTIKSFQEKKIDTL